MRLRHVCLKLDTESGSRKSDGCCVVHLQSIPFMVLFGEEEISNGNVKIKDMGIKAEDVVPLDRLVPELLQRLAVAAQRGPLIAAVTRSAASESTAQQDTISTA